MRSAVPALARCLSRALATRPGTAPTLPLSPLTAVTAIDGRYARQSAPLRGYFSEFALIKYRIIVELEWLSALAAHPGVPEVAPLSPAAAKAIADIVANFDATAAARVKEIEATTNHDVKAVEYYLKEAFASSAGGAELAQAAEFLHFACTSEDVNNLAYALMVRDARDAVLLPAMKGVIAACVGMAESLAAVPMLSRTHGQAATPTTMGKEWANWAARLAAAAADLKSVRILGKFNGAVGSFNAHAVAYPGLDWEAAARGLVEGRLGLTYNPYSTQIDPHDWVASWAHSMARFNTILLDLDRDAWTYISVSAPHPSLCCACTQHRDGCVVETSVSMLCRPAFARSHPALFPIPAARLLPAAGGGGRGGLLYDASQGEPH